MHTYYHIVSIQPTGRYYLCKDGFLRDSISSGMGGWDTIVYRRKSAAFKKLAKLHRADSWVMETVEDNGTFKDTFLRP